MRVPPSSHSSQTELASQLVFRRSCFKTRVYKNLQDSARFNKILQDSSRLCNILWDTARFCKILQDSAKLVKFFRIYMTIAQMHSGAMLQCLWLLLLKVCSYFHKIEEDNFVAVAATSAFPPFSQTNLQSSTLRKLISTWNESHVTHAGGVWARSRAEPVRREVGEGGEPTKGELSN